MIIVAARRDAEIVTRCAGGAWSWGFPWRGRYSERLLLQEAGLGAMCLEAKTNRTAFLYRDASFASGPN